MSAAGRGPRGGEAADYFTSPSWTVRRLLESWTPPVWHPNSVWAEPGAGNGAIIAAVDGATDICRARGILRGAAWRAFEIREEEHAGLERLCGPGRVTIGNFLHLDGSHVDRDVRVVLGNPPYTWAFEFLRQSKLLFPNAEILFLLRQAFTASQDRYRFMREHVPDKFELPDRPSFNGDGGGDSADYAWMRWPVAWERTKGELVLLNQTPLEERQRDKGHKVIVEDPQAKLFA